VRRRRSALVIIISYLGVFKTSRATLTGFRVIIGNRQAVKPMDEPVESILADVLALEGEDENAIREGDVSGNASF
jgi:hypothetical protein